LYLAGGATLLFLIIMVMVAAERAAKQSRITDETDNAKITNNSLAANEITGKYTNGIVPTEAKPLDIPEQAMIPEARPINLDQPPLPPKGPSPANNSLTPEEELANRIQQIKTQQFEEAVKSKTAVNIVAPRSPGSPPDTPNSLSEQQAVLAQQIAANQPTETDPMTAYKNRLAQLKKAGIIGTTNGNTDVTGDSSQQIITASAGNNAIGQYSNNGQGDRWRLDSKPEPPRSPYELRAGFVMPGTLISGINSQLPGQIMAQLSQDVYDTATGKYKLFPQGSRFVGTYSSEVAYGQARVLVAWQRLVFPDGKAMDIGAMPGADGAGYGGFEDQVDNHYLRIFGSALLMSAISAGATLSQQQNQASGFNNGGFFAPNAQSTLSSALGQQLGQATVQMIAKNLSIAPTLEIRPGYRFNIIVTKDLTLSKPYEAFDY
jgi:type IV secretion system protein VirB10